MELFKIYNTIIKEWKNLSDSELKFQEYVYGLDIKNNLSKLKFTLLAEFEGNGWDKIPLDWYAQWLPYAEKEIQDWYHGFIDFEDKVSKIKTGILPKDTNLDYLTYNGADYEIKKSLLIVCQPLKDKITQECQDGTLYNKNVD
jgi:hypothetical protein